MNNVIKLKVYFVLMAILWAMLILWHVRSQYIDYEQNIIKIATKEADLTYQKDALYREWGAVNGGVYVPISKFTPPNSYLEMIPNRDIVTTEGTVMTLINPAYMTRLVFEMANGDIIQGHLTSDNYLNPANKPDFWEVKALKELYTGKHLFSEKTEINEKPYLRFMKPFIIKQECLKCHAYQGYKLGDIRGGISVEVPLAGYYAALETEAGHMYGTNTLIFVLGITVLYFIYLQLRNAALKEEQHIKSQEMMFREFNHRVKNNLQIISSIIDISSGITRQNGKDKILDEIQRRLVDMSCLHEMFVQKNSLEGIAADKFIADLCRAYKGTKVGLVTIEINANVESFKLPNTYALNCGLILNELITNSIKHAFNEYSVNPSINISLTCSKNIVTLKYTDNGSGFADKVIDSSSFGLSLVESIAEKIEADLAIDGSNSFTAILIFKI